MLRGKTYQEVYRNFKWKIPQYYNIGVDVCDRWADDSQRIALIYIDGSRNEIKFTFRELKNRSNRLANALKANGIKRQDRVGLLLSQRPETLISHIAIYNLAAVALPLLTLFGPDAIEFRLRDSMAKAVITDNENLPKLLELTDRLPDLELIIAIDGSPKQGVLDFEECISKGSRDFTPVQTEPRDRALIIIRGEMVKAYKKLKKMKVKPQ